MTYPEVEEWKAFTGLQARHLELQDRYRDTAKASDRLDRTRDQALEADREAYAQALIDGKPDPGQKHVQAHDKDAAAKRREMEALQVAVQRTEDEIQDLLNAEGAEQAAALEAAMAEGRVKAQGLLEELAAVLTDVQTQGAVAAWIQRARRDGQAVSYRGASTGTTGLAEGLKGPNGYDHTLEAVFTALRATLEGPKPPKVRQPGEHVPLQEQNWGAVAEALPQTASGPQ
ncbi:hypothetical protein [Nocardioides piscis]|uniref:Uncharacterized protein n=1 Tax=Nocardioides piscis TaxID=2714938 RepID=A0A6G7YGL9_9ACTN|nr:hypothetical protein [Nocardioides piscis]QIK76044.1 hypothetical protein G7071_11970 [Nocardioides piscis]